MQINRRVVRRKAGGHFTICVKLEASAPFVRRAPFQGRSFVRSHGRTNSNRIKFHCTISVQWLRTSHQPALPFDFAHPSAFAQGRL